MGCYGVLWGVKGLGWLWPRPAAKQTLRDIHFRVSGERVQRTRSQEGSFQPSNKQRLWGRFACDSGSADLGGATMGGRGGMRFSKGPWLWEVYGAEGWLDTPALLPRTSESSWLEEST